MINPCATEIPAVHEHARYADGRCHSRLTTLRSGRQMKFTRRMEHLSVWLHLHRRPVETILGLKMRDIFGGKRTPPPPAWVKEGLLGCA